MICSPKNFKKIMREVGRYRSSTIFSHDKDEIAYGLSIIKNNRERGHAAECIVRDFLISRNKRVHHFGGRHPFDMLVNGSRTEIKSALASVRIMNGKKYYTYQFRNIKTNNFDKLILVFISPEGIHIREMTCDTAKQYLANAKSYTGGRILKVRHAQSKLSGNKSRTKVLVG